MLNINKCSLLGWSDGGNTALIMAAKYPQLVDKLVVWGANAYFTDEDIEAYESKIEGFHINSKEMMNSVRGASERITNFFCCHFKK